MKNFCKNLKEHAIKIINCEKKEMASLTKEENRLYYKQKVCYICTKNSVLIMMIKNIIRLEIIILLLYRLLYGLVIILVNKKQLLTMLVI